MGSNEEYLDSLLKAAIENDEAKEKAEDMKETQQDENRMLSPEEIAAMFGSAEEPKAASEDELVETEAKEISEEPEAEISVDNMLGNLGNEEEVTAQTEDYSQDIAELLGSFGGEDDELEEINKLLNKSDSENTVDDDMLALLEDISEENDSEYARQTGTEEPDEIDIFAMDALNQEGMEEEPAISEEGQEQSVATEEMKESLEEKSAPKKEKKKWFKKRNKKKKEPEEAKDRQPEEEKQSELEKGEELKEEEIDIFGNELFEIGESEGQLLQELGEGQEISKVDSVGPKKQGVFSKIMDFLTEEEEEPSEEVQKVKKEKKSNKKKKKNTRQPKEPDGDENEEILKELDKEDKKGKKGKKKKVKIEKTAKQPEDVLGDGKKLPKKIVTGIFAICLSLLALIIIASIFIPDLLSLKEARKAYYQNNYMETYKNLAGKDLNSSDSLILEKAKTLMTLQRQYDSFVNYHKMNKEAEALNALIKGCSVYEELKETAAEQNILTELDEIYSNILYSLEYLYGVTEEKALQLYSLEDDYEYTTELKKLIGEAAAGDESQDVITGGSESTYRSGE